jgi:sugar lactone lactonase YvrE
VRYILTVLALSAAAGFAAAQGGFVEHFKAAMEAHDQGKDYARMEAELRAALKLRPGHPTATYKLAAAQALRGQAEAALETLERLGDMGLYFEPWNDADFASLKGEGDFKSARRAFRRNAEPRGRPERMFRLRSPTFIPDGMTYDEDRGHFYFGSVHGRRIQRVMSDDTEADFVKPHPGLWAPFGMVVDEKRDLLWVATNAVPEMKDARAEELGRAAIVAYPLKSGVEKRRFEPPAGEHKLTDVIIVRDMLYATDSRGGWLYAIDPDKGTFTALSKPGELASPQGLVEGRNKRELFIADYTQGVFRYDIKAGKLERLEVDEDISVYGIDGLYRHRDHLIAIQNGVRPHRVVRLELSGTRRVRNLRVLVANDRDFDHPTSGVVVDKNFYFIANSQSGRFDKDHRLPPAEQLRRPMILRLPLDDENAPPGTRQTAPAQPSSGPLPDVPCVGPLC